MDVLMECIDHVVVLMLENRSFDCLLGRLYPRSEQFDGLDLGAANPGEPGQPSVPVWNRRAGDDAVPLDPDTLRIPDPDPGERWLDMNMQIFGKAEVGDADVPDMSGFVRSYLQQPMVAGHRRDPGAVMHYFSPEQVPVLSRLARQFAVCDRWHAAAPCQTWPNRFFVHTGSANGYENNGLVDLPFPLETVFNRLSANKKLADPWHVYFHDVPQTLTLGKLWDSLDRFRLYSEFQKDARHGTLPSYSFIEPRYFPGVEDLPNDQHPPHVVTLGERLIADVYNSLRNGPTWTRTLLIITYDEHGGCYDHVPPPKAVPPGPKPTRPFNFDRYGVRVPAVLVSPYIRTGTVLRTRQDQPPFDHTSILATLRRRFDLGQPFSAREAVAPDLGAVFGLDQPLNDGPQQLQALPYAASPAELARARAESPNDMQQALLRLSAHLPRPAGSPALSTGWMRELEAKLLEAVVPLLEEEAADALHFIKHRMGALFQHLS